MQKLYQSIFSSVAMLDTYNRLDEDICTYVAEKGDGPAAVLLFRRERNRIYVLNEVIRLDAAEIKCFTNAMFDRFSSTGAITFNAIRTELRDLALPIQSFNCSEDIVITLPETSQQYEASLGKATRKNLRRYINKLARDFPSLHYEVLTGDQIKEQHVRQIFEFNRARMAEKNKVSSLDDAEAERMFRLVRSSGMVTMLSIDGRMCAGEICSRAGTHYFSHVGAHDRAYDSYSLGTISCYLSICECIDRGGQEFHMLWGQYAYKYLLRGVQRDLQHLAIYRSRFHVFLNASMALKIAVRSHIRKIKSVGSGSDSQGIESSYAVIMFRALTFLRSLNRIARAQ